MRYRNLAVATFAACNVLLPMGRSAAQTLTVGVPVSNNCIPFGCPALFSITRFQQIYAASAFTVVGAGFINSLTFFVAQDGAFNAVPFSIYLSTTSSIVNGLSTNPANNVGSNSTFFTTFAPGNSAIPAQFTITGTPFFYNPAAGNLLMEIFMPNVPDRSFGFLKADNTGKLMSRYYGSDQVGSANEWGIVTQFGFGNLAIVPEPATVALVAAGLVLICAANTRCKRIARW